MLIISCQPSTWQVFATQEKQVMVVQNSTNLYSSTDFNSVVLCTIPHKTILDSHGTVNNEYTFYKVTYNNFTGFVYANHCMDMELASPTEFLDYNGKIKSESANVYYKVNESFSKFENITLIKDTEIRILDGYDIDKEYTLVSFIYENANFTYYIKTTDITPYGVSRTLIVAISIIITCISLILLLFGSSFKKLKKKS